jgi:Leucine-rich repeat (LRR) protein
MNEILWQILEKSNVKTILNLRVINKSFNNYCKKYKKQLIRIIFRQAGYVTINDFSYKELLEVIYKIGIHKLESSLITDYETMKNYETKIRHFMYKNITNYNCSHSNLYHLPLMPNLRVLNCSFNRITYIPNYPKMEILLCNNNVVYFITMRDVNKITRII